MTNLDSVTRVPPSAGPRPQRIVLNRAPEKSAVQRRLERERARLMVGVVDPDEFAIELAEEFDRRTRGGRNCMVGSISIFEIPGLEYKYGPDYVFDVVTEVTALLVESLSPMDLVTVAEDGEILIMARESRLPAAIKRVERVCRQIASRRFDEDGEGILLTPSAGVATLDDGADPADVVRRAIDAREVAAGHLDLSVHRWEPAMSADTAPPEKEPFDKFNWQNIKERLRAPSQILATYVLGLFVPFCFYWSMANLVGYDISWFVYITVVVVLVLTGMMILIEANQAVKQKEPPEVDEYPLATAIICAYMPNEAATIKGTIEAFLNQGYPGGIQIIVAYNTPNSMPIERELAVMAEGIPNLDIVRVEGSTSKAQNVNAVLAMARGAFIGMFDADHEPRPGSFERAWRWLANGYDVVQGHCLTRNGHESWLAKMIAVEFESIYAVAHPGRARIHRFGVFGGSNGYWKTELLHETRMRGSMLTEDIDSSMRTVERGLKIRSDRDVVSRELGTTTFTQVWNQRLRWAQGWFQVTMIHTIRIWKSPGLTLRQKFGASYLLGYREVYPWLSLQVFPLVAFWMTRGDSFGMGFPVFFCTTLFVLHIGPVQTWYAYRLADWEIKQHKKWFWGYLLFSTVFYTEYKNTIARVAHIKEFVGERAWKVTPRSDDPIEFDETADDALEFDDVEVAVEPATLETGDGAPAGADPAEAEPSVSTGGLPVRAGRGTQPVPGREASEADRPLPARLPARAQLEASLARARDGFVDPAGTETSTERAAEPVGDAVRSPDLERKPVAGSRPATDGPPESAADRVAHDLGRTPTGDLPVRARGGGSSIVASAGARPDADPRPERRRRPRPEPTESAARAQPVPAIGLVGEPVLSPKHPRQPAPTSRLDELLIARRVRRLAERRPSTAELDDATAGPPVTASQPTGS